MSGSLDTTNISDAGGRRVRLRAKPAAIAQIYGTSAGINTPSSTTAGANGILGQIAGGNTIPGINPTNNPTGVSGLMAPLALTNGVVFPYQPTVTYQQDVDYQPIDLVHTNQEFYAYTRTRALKLSIDGEFTVQSQKEGLYALACIHFFRTVTKMYFGQNSAIPGTPPPVLLFDAYGQYMFNSLPVIVTQFSVTLPKDVDYVPVYYSQTNSTMPQNVSTSSNISNINSQNVGAINSQGYAWLPTLFNIQVQITVQNTPSRLKQFDLTSFRNGTLLAQGGWV